MLAKRCLRTLCLMALAWPVACTSTMYSEDISLMPKGTTFDRVGDYKIGPGDTLNVRVLDEESLTGEYVVAPSGLVQMPLIGFLEAQGLTAVQLAQKMERSLRPFIRESRVAISISNALSYQVFFSGEVAARGAREMRAKTSILQGLILAGGLTDFATGRIFLIRHVNDNEVKRYSTTYKDLLRGRQTLDFIYLERGDVIHAE